MASHGPDLSTPTPIALGAHSSVAQELVRILLWASTLAGMFPFGLGPPFLSHFVTATKRYYKCYLFSGKKAIHFFCAVRLSPLCTRELVVSVSADLPSAATANCLFRLVDFKTWFWQFCWKDKMTPVDQEWWNAPADFTCPILEHWRRFLDETSFKADFLVLSICLAFSASS